ncbi:MAG: T9SS type A sorting domain-containing protein, partial [Bacteroidales bacterium]|nr:T9SS type A sorting domain-containing protein [Bacteroidales bacterium]
PKTKISTSILREMDAMYKSLFINYAMGAKEDLTVGDYGDLLVICTERDEDAIQPFIDWKKEKGFNVTKEVVEVATNVKALIQDAYDNNPDLLYVQLVGDWADIKCDIGGGASAPMDPMLGCVEGGDWYPEIAIGRFSGNSPAHITVQVNKAITYEKTPEIDGAWYSHSLGIGSSEGSSNGDDSEMDKTHIQIIYDNKLDPFSYDQQYTSYDPGANSGQVATAVGEGVSIVNYCGHGSNTAWSTSGFSNSHIAQLTNGEKLPFIISVACVNGAFHQGECFGEAWLKKEGGGAVMTLMATINQPWQPPMRGQDYMNDILTGGYDYDNNPGSGTNTEEGRTFLGPIVVNGLILMYDESSGSSDLETIQTWTTFGDCSLQPRTIAPAELSLDNDVIISGVDFAATVSSDGNPVEGAMVGLTQADGDLFYSAISDENGEFTIPHELLPGDAKLVVTAFNMQTIYMDVIVISPDGPYLVIDGFEMNTADGLVVYNSEVSMDITFKNLGSDPANDVTVTLTSEDDEFCTLLSDITVTIGSIQPDETITIEEAFIWAIADDATDQYLVTLNFDINGTAKELWQDNVSFKINAPALDIAFMEIDDSNGGDGNGRLDAGETALLIYHALNIGHAESPEANMSLNTSSPYITINTSALDLGTIVAEGNVLAEFEVVVADDAPIGTLANFSTDLVAGNYNDNNSQMLTLGLVVEDWETGDFTQYDWQFAGNADWEIIDGMNVYEGDYSAKSMDIGNNQTASLTLDVNAATESSISFFYKVSSESGYDKLKFYIDNVEQGSWDGEVDWTSTEYDISAGDHSIKWTYSKDGSVDGGSDCAWVDYIVLPGAAGGSPLFADFMVDNQDICDGQSVNFTSSSVGDVTEYAWTFEGGDPATSNEEAPMVVYSTPGTYSVSLTITDGNSENTMTKDDFIMVHNCTGINEASVFSLEIYPNPSNGIFTLKLNQTAHIEIISALGRTVFSDEFIGKQTIDLAEQAEGVYFVKVETANETFVEKIVVRR